MFYTLAADAVVTFHVAYVGFVILGQVLILVGVALEMALGAQPVVPPGTSLRHRRRRGGSAVGHRLSTDNLGERVAQLGGQTVTEGTFISRLLHSVLFYDNVEPWVFTSCYCRVRAPGAGNDDLRAAAVASGKCRNGCCVR